MSYTPEELPQVTGTSWVSAILLAGLVWEGPFLLPAVYLQQHVPLHSKVQGSSLGVRYSCVEDRHVEQSAQGVAICLMCDDATFRADLTDM